MTRLQPHHLGKAESLFGNILKPFFDSIGPELPRSIEKCYGGFLLMLTEKFTSL